MYPYFKVRTGTAWNDMIVVLVMCCQDAKIFPWRKVVMWLMKSVCLEIIPATVARVGVSGALGNCGRRWLVTCHGWLTNDGGVKVIKPLVLGLKQPANSNSSLNRSSGASFLTSDPFSNVSKVGLIWGDSMGELPQRERGIRCKALSVWSTAPLDR